MCYNPYSGSFGVHFLLSGEYNRKYYVRARHRRLQAASRRWPRAALLLVLNYRTLRTLIQHMHPLICNIWPIIICATDDRTKKRNEATYAFANATVRRYELRRRRPKRQARPLPFFFLRLFCLCVSTRHTAEPSCTGSSRFREAFCSSRSSPCPPPPEFMLCGRSASRHFRMHHIVVGE